MTFTYNGYTLTVEQEQQEVGGDVMCKVSCYELSPFSVWYTTDYWNSNSEDIIDNFKQKIDEDEI